MWSCKDVYACSMCLHTSLDKSILSFSLIKFQFFFRNYYLLEFNLRTLVSGKSYFDVFIDICGHVPDTSQIKRVNFN